MPMTPTVTIIGGGLAGSEAAWQIADRGVPVRLVEMRPTRPTPAHTGDRLAELVCSNSMGSTLPDRALGILKNEMLGLGSLIITTAFKHALPAGSALAVSRDDFAEEITAAISSHPNITVVREEATDIPAGPTILATGPLTSDALTGPHPGVDRAAISLLLRCNGPHRRRRQHRHDRRLSPEPL